ncbi:hypothetical protein [Paenibacillus sp. CF384]|uniref:hypothetical protein n=1 Tax=Paenibacillus sp. CF384 TaxID=1884382 RepID=UPI00089B3A43|nr:hypothetical protein [Paenibacillus sp. CF384]SDW70157.1 hypothetical protein SAMN05518855_1004196 [Paenibacillus sp. CF384]
MAKATRSNKELNELSADDLALWAAIILVVGDLFGLLAVLKARTEKEELLESPRIMKKERSANAGTKADYSR